MSTSVARKNVFVEEYPIVTEAVELAASQTLEEGALIGIQAVDDTVVIAQKSGSGFTVPDPLPTVVLCDDVTPKVGVYTATVTQLIYDGEDTSSVVVGALFNLTDPDGYSVGVMQAATEFSQNGLTVTLPLIVDVVSPATTGYVVGDAWEITVAVGDGYGYQLDKTKADGTNVFAGVLRRDATVGAAETDLCPMAVSCRVLHQGLSVATGTVDAALIAEMKAKNCYVDVDYSDNNLNGV